MLLAAWRLRLAAVLPRCAKWLRDTTPPHAEAAVLLCMGLFSTFLLFRASVTEPYGG
jgi:hypothetical protein